MSCRVCKDYCVLTVHNLINIASSKLPDLLLGCVAQQNKFMYFLELILGLVCLMY
jgi:hypothetical protein